MFSTSTAVRLLAGATLTGAVVLSVGATASAATPSSWQRTHSAHHVVTTHAPTGVSIGSATAYVMGPNGTPIAVSPTTLP